MCPCRTSEISLLKNSCRRKQIQDARLSKKSSFVRCMLTNKPTELQACKEGRNENLGFFSLSYSDLLGRCWVRPWGGLAAVITLTWAEGFPIPGTVILSEIRSCPLRCRDEGTEAQRGQSSS